MEPLPHDRVACRSGFADCQSQGLPRAMPPAIMTTDTVPKAFPARSRWRRGGDHHRHQQGAGMIRPKATMLGSWPPTLVFPSPDGLNWRWHWPRSVVQRATVDGDTSTNDSCLWW
jgi:N-acetylglutamate synthase/N-acetylornithine aminotransferase